MKVTAFQPDVSGNVYVCLQSNDGFSNGRILITQEQKGNLAVGDTLNVVLSSGAIAGAVDNLAAGVDGPLVALQKANADLQAQLDATTDALKAANDAAAAIALAAIPALPLNPAPNPGPVNPGP